MPFDNERREFIKAGGYTAIGMLILPACNSSIDNNYIYSFFSKDEASCLIAFCEQIIPADEQFGGATDANVIQYIDNQLSSVFKDQASKYRVGIEQLQNHCKKVFGVPFQKLSSPEQIDLMTALQRNELQSDSWLTPGNFFRMVRTHTMQGYYGSPIHGGNKEYLSFKMLELGPPLNMD